MALMNWDVGFFIINAQLSMDTTLRRTETRICGVSRDYREAIIVVIM